MAFIGNSLAQGLISGANIQDGTVDTPDIATSAVSTAKVADNAVTTLKLNSAGIAPTITGGTINGAVIGGTTAAAGSFTTVIASTSISSPSIISSGATPILFRPNGVTRMTIGTDGDPITTAVGLSVTGNLSVTGTTTFGGDITTTLGKFYVVNTYGYYFGSSGSLTGFTGSNGTGVITLSTYGTTRATFDTNGVSVTGFLSATGTMLSNNVSGTTQFRSGIGTDLSLSTGEGLEILTTATTSTRVMSYSRTAAAFRTLDLAGSSVRMSPNNSTVGEFSTTGLAVTGTLSATSNVSTTANLTVGSSGNGGQTITTLQGYATNSVNGSYGRLLFSANTNYTGSARQFLLTNALGVNSFAIIRSVDATTTPTLDSGGAVSSGAADFVINYNGNIGIGANVPVSKFEVYDSAVSAAFVANTPSTWRVAQIRHDQTGTNGTAAGIAFVGKSDTQPAGIVAINGNTTGGVVSLAFLTVDGNATAERMRITSSGNLGIGTTNPLGKLQIEGNDLILNTENSAQAKLLYFRYSNGASIQSDSYLTFNTGGSPTEKVRITASGAVGIGLDGGDPEAKFHVKMIRSSSTSGIALLLSDNVTGGQTNNVYKAIRAASNSGASVSEIRFVETDGTNNNTAIAFATAHTAGGLSEKARISPGGNLLVGTAVDMVGTGGLTVQGNFSHGTASVVATTGSYTVPDGAASITFYSMTGTATLTLPNPGTHNGRMLWVRTQSNHAVISASANVTALVNGTAGTAILSGTQGKWALLAADGSYWNIIAAN